MGILAWLGFGGSTTAGVQNPMSPTDALVTFAADQWLRDRDKETLGLTREGALRVPAVKRAHGIHCSIVAGLPFQLMDGETPATLQPGWTTNSESGISPYHRMYGVTSDLFMHGWACIGFTEELDDAMHIPWGWWGVNQLEDNRVVVTDKRIPDKYRARLIAIPMGYGNNGLLFDGADSIRAAQDIERVWMERVRNPSPATNLHITDPAFDNISGKEKRRIVDQWNENRARDGGQVAVTQSYLEVISLGSVSADLFEKGRNAIRLDLANHTAVPASIVEGARDGGGSDINYSNDATDRNELYDFGTKGFVQAIEGRLSLNDVSEPGQSYRADLSNFMAVPSPASNPTSTD